MKRDAKGFAGRKGHGLAALQRAVEINPDVAAPRLDLGVALLTLGRVAEAIAALRAAVRLEGADGRSHYYLGVALLDGGRPLEAIAAYETALELDPDFADARLRLADLCLAVGRRAKAAAAFRVLAESTANPAMRRYHKARALEADGEPARAIEAMQALAAGEAAPDGLLLRLAWLLAQVGRLEEAEGVFERVASAGQSAAWHGYASVHRFTATDQAVIARLNAALTQPHLSSADRERLHFALGKAHDDIGQYAVAMRNFEAANRLRARRSRFDTAALARFVDHTIAATGSEQLAGGSGSLDPTPVLIVGMPRSGTTLIEQILSSHPQVSAGGEMRFWTDRAGRGEPLDLTGAKDGVLAADYLAELRTISPTAARVTDKMPFNFASLGVIGRIFPKSTLIHCRRRPIDTCLSILTTWFATPLDFAADRASLVAYYRQYERLMDHWRRVMPPERLVEVDYELLVADPEPHARRLIAASGLAWDDACLAPHQNRRTVATANLWQARQPIYASSVARARRYEPWLGELRQLEVG